MAYTTTATTTYPLVKYSRSYPISGGNTTTTTTHDWQHFTNPSLRLVLDVTKTEKSELRSVRIKVIWTIQNGGVIVTTNGNSDEIVLASIFTFLPYPFVCFLLSAEKKWLFLDLGRCGFVIFLDYTAKNGCFYDRSPESGI